uniref:Nephrocystin 3-like N-terminal domain-containing protein n=1 Tax=Mycena chlorophos TaxID=658473 RepID=A0ABQ0LIB9_MYCCL|nr:predicted protein [Mycena chlorophos]
MDSLRSHIDNMHIQPIPSPTSSQSPTRSTFRRTPSAHRSSFAMTADSADSAGDSLRSQNTSLVPSLTLTRSTFRRASSVSYIQVTLDSADLESNSLRSQHMPMPLVPSLTPSWSASRYSSSASYVVVDNITPVGSPPLASDADMDKKATERQHAVEWVSPIDFSILHQEISKSRERNTGDWLLEHPTFEDWYLGFDSSNRLLWCSGASGVGKTVLVSKIVDHLQQESSPHIGVACLYLRYQETVTQTLQNLMGAVWRQLASDRDIDAAVLLHQQNNKTTISLSQIQDLLHSASKRFLHIYIVVDAVDEYVGSQVQLLDNILAIGPDVKLLTTSRRSFTYTGPRSIIEIELESADPAKTCIETADYGQIVKASTWEYSYAQAYVSSPQQCSQYKEH